MAGGPLATSGTASTVGPEVFGRYQILERIAVGGMAELFLAQSASLGGVNRTCVIKRILPQYSHDLTFVSMFIDEARITIGLDHKNIVKLYDFGQVDGTYFMAIEYVDGTDLSALMRAHMQLGRALPPALAAFVAREILVGLAHAHTLKDHNGRPLGIVHRDISPQNTLLAASGDVKLTDFGIAAARHKLTLTSPGTVLGKAAYMSPEQATGKPVDNRTDLWAVGVLLHEMLAGERLFADESPIQTVHRVVHDVIAPPSQKAPGVAQALDRVVMRALERRVGSRYSTAQEMADELTAYLESEATPPFGSAALGDYLSSLDWADDTARLRPMRAPKSNDASSPDASSPNASSPRPQGVVDRELDRLFGQLKKQPDLWTLVAIGERYGKLGKTGPALSAFRTAAALFAHQGLLVQALCAYDGCKAMRTPSEVEADLVALGDLPAGARGDLADLLARFDAHGFYAIMKEADPDDFGDNAEPPPFPAAPTPLLGSLGPTELAKLGALVRVRRVRPGEVIIREGESGDALYAVGRGRLVVYCRPGVEELPSPAGSLADEFDDETHVEAPLSAEGALPSQDGDRVYLAGLADGDFFGEFSFLTEKPRSATVESINDALLLEVRRDAVQATLADETFTEPLLQFYKERVVELLMAKSPVFALLEPHQRKALLRNCTVREFHDSELIVEEGTESDALYFVKRGEVEVFRTDPGGIPIFINKLVQGQFFGEIAALTKSPRSVSVRAMGDASLLTIRGDALLKSAARQPRLRELLDATIAARTAEIRDRVREHERVFFGT